jgi:hypothetical protein
MSRCLGDRRLWLLSEGEGSRADRAHVASCVACGARLRRLEEDLCHLTSVLRAPPPQVAPTRPRPIRLQWMTAAAMLAAMFMVVWVGLWWQQPSPPVLPMEVSQESIGAFIDAVSAALFATVDPGVMGAPDPLPDLDDLQAALAGDWPCDEQAVFGDVTCDDETFALFLGGQ